MGRYRGLTFYLGWSSYVLFTVWPCMHRSTLRVGRPAFCSRVGMGYAVTCRCSAVQVTTVSVSKTRTAGCKTDGCNQHGCARHNAGIVFLMSHGLH